MYIYCVSHTGVYRQVSFDDFDLRKQRWAIRYLMDFSVLDERFGLDKIVNSRSVHIVGGRSILESWYFLN